MTTLLFVKVKQILIPHRALHPESHDSVPYRTRLVLINQRHQ